MFEILDIKNKRAFIKNSRRGHVELKGLSDVAYFDDYYGMESIALVYQHKILLWESTEFDDTED